MSNLLAILLGAGAQAKNHVISLMSSHAGAKADAPVETGTAAFSSMLSRRMDKADQTAILTDDAALVVMPETTQQEDAALLANADVQPSASPLAPGDVAKDAANMAALVAAAAPAMAPSVAPTPAPAMPLSYAQGAEISMTGHPVDSVMDSVADGAGVSASPTFATTQTSAWASSGVTESGLPGWQQSAVARPSGEAITAAPPATTAAGAAKSAPSDALPHVAEGGVAEIASPLMQRLTTPTQPDFQRTPVRDDYRQTAGRPSAQPAQEAPLSVGGRSLPVREHQPVQASSGVTAETLARQGQALPHQTPVMSMQSGELPASYPEPQSYVLQPPQPGAPGAKPVEYPSLLIELAGDVYSEETISGVNTMSHDAGVAPIPTRADLTGERPAAQSNVAEALPFERILPSVAERVLAARPEFGVVEPMPDAVLPAPVLAHEAVSVVDVMASGGVAASESPMSLATVNPVQPVPAPTMSVAARIAASAPWQADQSQIASASNRVSSAPMVSSQTGWVTSGQDRMPAGSSVELQIAVSGNRTDSVLTTVAGVVPANAPSDVGEKPSDLFRATGQPMQSGVIDDVVEYVASTETPVHGHPATSLFRDDMFAVEPTGIPSAHLGVPRLPAGVEVASPFLQRLLKREITETGVAEAKQPHAAPLHDGTVPSGAAVAELNPRVPGANPNSSAAVWVSGQMATAFAPGTPAGKADEPARRNDVVSASEPAKVAGTSPSLALQQTPAPLVAASPMDGVVPRAPLRQPVESTQQVMHDATTSVRAAQDFITSSQSPTPVNDSPAPAQPWPGFGEMSLRQPQPVAQQLSVDTPVRSPMFASELGEKVVWLAARNIQTAEISLNPSHLGPLEVTLSFSGGEAGAQFYSAHAQVRDALEAALPKLREMMADAGVNLGQTHVRDESLSRQNQFFSQQQARGNLPAEPEHHAGRQDVPAGQATQRPSRGLIDLYA